MVTTSPFMNATTYLLFQTCSYSCSKHTHTAFTEVAKNDLCSTSHLHQKTQFNRLSPKTHMMISVKCSSFWCDKLQNMFLPFSDQIILLYELLHGLIQYLLLDIFYVFLGFIKHYLRSASLHCLSPSSPMILSRSLE